MKGYTLLLLFAFITVSHGYSFKFRDELEKAKETEETETESKTEVADQEDKEEAKSEVAEAVQDPAMVQFISLGCWNDAGNRAFKSNAKRFGSDTIQQCADRARRLGNVVFAVQDNTECWTAGVNGAKYALYEKSTKCKNGRGGWWTNSVYQLAPGNRNQKWLSLGCYKDEGGNGRAFKGGPKEVDNGNALNECRNLAIQRGHNFFGLEDAPWWKRWCYTGNNVARHTKHGIKSGCGDGRGGSWHVNVYQVLTPVAAPQVGVVHVVYNDQEKAVEK